MATTIVNTGNARMLSDVRTSSPRRSKIGVGYMFDSRLLGNPASGPGDLARAQFAARMTANTIAGNVPVDVLCAQTPIMSPGTADAVAQQLTGIDAAVFALDTWAWPQETLMNFISQFPKNMPLLLLCGNSGPKPGVVFANSVNGALAQSGRLAHLIVGSWPDTGNEPLMTESTASALVNWSFAAKTAAGLQGKRIMSIGHDSMGMETAIANVLPTREFFGIEIDRIDMKLISDLLDKRAYDKNELAALRAWIDQYIGNRLEIRNADDNERFNKSLAMYLIVADLMMERNCIAGGFMSQLEWGSMTQGLPKPVADVMESLFNSTFNHRGPKPAVAFGTENDVQGTLTMLFMTELSGGNPPLFADFRKVWEAWEIRKAAAELGVELPNEDWVNRGFVDFDNSGSASFNWAGRIGASVEELMSSVRMPLADEFYFPGLGNSVNFVTPGGIEAIGARLAYQKIGAKDMFSMVWDNIRTVDLPAKLSDKVCRTSTYTWPHTFVMFLNATMMEAKHLAPANHMHATWGLPVSRLQYWMDMKNVISATPWAARPSFVEGEDRVMPLGHALLGGNDALAKMILAGRI